MTAIIFPSLLTVIVVFSCLFYGSTTLPPVVVIETLVNLALFAWLVDMGQKGRLSFLKTGLFLPLAALAVVVMFQLIPLPIGLIRILSGRAAYLYDSLIPSGSLPASSTLSIYPYVTILELFKTLAYVGIFFLVINNLESKKQFTYVINMIIILGVVISIFGIIQKYTYKGRVYWFDAPGTAPSPFGPFVNRNNFCGYINMIIPLSLGCFLAHKSWLKKTTYGLCVWIMVLALFLTSSRAGMLVFVVIMFSMLLLSQLKNSLKINTRTFFVYLGMVILLSFFYVDFKEIFRRFSTIFADNTLIAFGHGYSWKDILRIFRDFPLFGTGLGTFGSISPMYKTTLMQAHFSYAHNDYLQLLSEVGVAGVICVVVFFIFYFRNLISIWLNRHNTYVVTVVLGGISSVFGMLVYSLLDFNLHIPANALLFFVVMALTYRMAFTRFGDTHHDIPK